MGVTDTRKLLEKFRARIDDIPLDPFKASDGYLLNWLVHGGYNLDKTETIFRQNIEWREVNKIDSILSEDFGGLSELLPYEIVGADKEGRPVVYLKVGQWKLTKAVTKYPRETCIRYTLQYCERVEEACRKIFMESLINPEVEPVYQFTGIFDFKDFSIFEHLTPRNVLLARDLAYICESNWPNMIDKIFMINAKWVFRIFMNMLKGILTETSMGRLACYGNNQTQWTQEILKTIDADQLVVEYGGNLIKN